MLILPDVQDPALFFPCQSVTDQTDLQAIVNGLNQTGVIEGMEVTANLFTMTINIASGRYAVGGIISEFAGAADIPIDAADTTDRRDAVCIRFGSVDVIDGTPCAVANWEPSMTELPPVKPDIGNDNLSVLLAEVTVPAGTTGLETNVNIVDKSTIIEVVSPIVFNVKDYGALGDCSGDDTTALEDTIAAVGEGPGVIAFPQGCYLLDAITITNPGLSFWIIGGAELVFNSSVGTEAPWFHVLAEGVGFWGEGIMDGNGGVDGGDGNSMPTGQSLDAIYFDRGADDGWVEGITIRNTGRCVKSIANRTRVENTDQYWFSWAGTAIVTNVVGEPVDGGWVRGNRIRMPSAGTVSVHQTNGGVGINVQDPTTRRGGGPNPGGATWPGALGSGSITLSGYTLTGGEVGCWISIDEAGPDKYNATNFVEMAAVITSVDIGTNSVEVEFPLGTLPNAFTNNAFFIMNPPTNVVVDDNEFDNWTSGLPIQMNGTQYCVVSNNRLNAIQGAYLVPPTNTGQGLSLANGSVPAYGSCVGNIVNSNGRGAAIESDWSASTIADNVLRQWGNGGLLHCTNKYASDIKIIGNFLQYLDGPGYDNGARIGINFDAPPGAYGVQIIGNTIDMGYNVDNINSAAIQVFFWDFIIADNIIRLGYGGTTNGIPGVTGSWGIWFQQGGSLMGNIHDNHFSGPGVAFHYSDVEGAITDLSITNNLGAGDVVRMIDPTMLVGAADAIPSGASNTAVNLLFQGNRIAGKTPANSAPTKISTASGPPFLYANQNPWPVCATFGGTENAKFLQSGLTGCSFVDDGPGGGGSLKAGYYSFVVVRQTTADTLFCTSKVDLWCGDFGTGHSGNGTITVNLPGDGPIYEVFCAFEDAFLDQPGSVPDEAATTPKAWSALGFVGSTTASSISFGSISPGESIADSLSEGPTLGLQVKVNGLLYGRSPTSSVAFSQFDAMGPMTVVLLPGDLIELIWNASPINPANGEAESSLQPWFNVKPLL